MNAIHKIKRSLWSASAAVAARGWSANSAVARKGRGRGDLEGKNGPAGTDCRLCLLLQQYFGAPDVSLHLVLFCFVLFCFVLFCFVLFCFIFHLSFHLSFLPLLLFPQPSLPTIVWRAEILLLFLAGDLNEKRLNASLFGIRLK
jgi:hypothetical protein